LLKDSVIGLCTRFMNFQLFRYEYDMFIEANQHTIALLEPIERKIQHKMSSEEKAKFKLEPGLGGKSMIYQRVIKRVYDYDKGADVIEALHNNPATVVPVVLKRLKQKDEEWKRARVRNITNY
jgi:paired amphipathic helix protein Sin3a